MLKHIEKLEDGRICLVMNIFDHPPFEDFQEYFERCRELYSNQSAETCKIFLAGEDTKITNLDSLHFGQCKIGFPVDCKNTYFISQHNTMFCGKCRANMKRIIEDGPVFTLGSQMGKTSMAYDFLQYHIDLIHNSTKCDMVDLGNDPRYSDPKVKVEFKDGVFKLSMEKKESSAGLLCPQLERDLKRTYKKITGKEID